MRLPVVPARLAAGFALLLAASAGAAFLPARAGVVLNEIQYHPPGDDDSLQFVELHNAGPEHADLGRWRFTKGLKFEFPAGTALAPGGFVVVARDPAAFARAYPSAGMPLGPFEGRLKHSGERVELSDASANVVESVRFGDRDPWPLGPDGFGASLERICPASPAEEPGSWAGSVLPERRVPGGTPGRTNSVWSPTPPPRVESVREVPVAGGRSVRVEVRAAAVQAGGLTGRVAWETVDAEGRISPGAGADLVAGPDRLLAAEVPLPPAPAVLRYHVTLRDPAGGVRRIPAAEDPRPDRSLAVWPEASDSKLPQWHLVQFGPTEERGASLRHEPRSGGGGPAPSRGNGLMVRIPPGGGRAEVFDHLRITPRHGGWKVRFLKDQPLDGIATVNVLFEDRPRFVLSEHLSYELYRRAGVTAPASGHARVAYNGRQLGYHLWVEQPNAAFLRRVGLDDGGSLYKLLWYGDGLAGQHEPKTPAAEGHADLQDIVRRLRTARAPDRGALIGQAFDVENFAGYYAVSMCLQNWDGFFNNYFVHRAPGADGRWTIIPWDQDKTWGDFDGASAAYDWYTMPLTFGMAGDRAPSGGGGLLSLLGFGGGAGMGPWGGPGWWRPGGWFSAPLLADPTFRRAFLGRLEAVTKTHFTEAAFGPVIDDLAVRLRPEVAHRAAARGLDPAREVERFDRHIESFRNQLRERGRFLRDQLPAVRTAP